METLSQLLRRRRQLISGGNVLLRTITAGSAIYSVYQYSRTFLPQPEFLTLSPRFNLISTNRENHSSASTAKESWLMGFGKKMKPINPEIVKAGEPVLHEPARSVSIEEIGLERIQKIIDDMVNVMRSAYGVGLAAPQIGIPLRIIVLEYKEDYLHYSTKDEIREEGKQPFDLVVIVNPKLKKTSDKTALFFEGCLSVDGFGAAVERNLEVEVTGLSREGQPIKIVASNWQARVLQHECDHLDGTLYVDKMLPKTFRTLQNLYLPLAKECPKLGVRR